MENTLRLLLSVFIVCNGNEIQNVTLTDVLQNKFITLKCPWNQTISVKEFTTGNVKCKTDENNNKCMQIISNKLMAECIDRNNCTLSSEILSMNDCHRTPRYITADYRCKLGRLESKTVTATTCSTTLSEIECIDYWFFIDFEIEITKVILDISNLSRNCNDALQELKELCNDRVICLNRPETSQCLFHPREATILYVCKDPNAPLSSSTSPVEKTETYTTLLSKTETNEDISSTLGITTDSSLAVYPERITLDQEGRVLLTNTLHNMTVQVCGEGWDNRDAYVVCKYQNNSFIGKAKTIGGVQDYETIPLVIQCHGNETNPLDCNRIRLNRGCNTSIVAAVTCCKGNDSTISCPTKSVEQMSLGEPANGIAIGVSVGLCVSILVVALSLVIIFRRFHICTKATNSETNSSYVINSSNDYVGNQTIALPNLNKNTISKNCTSRESGHCTKGVFKYDEQKLKRTSTECTSAPINGVALPKLFPNLSGTGNITTTQENDRYDFANSISVENNSASEYTYACSEDVVYDKAKSNRHVQAELNVYSHSIDIVYDTSDRNRNRELSTDTYDHFVGHKSDDNYDLAIRK